MLKYCFTDISNCPYLGEFRQALSEFVQYVKSRPEPDQLFEVMVAAFKTNAQSLDEHHTKAWAILEDLAKNDPCPWPEEVSHDPANPTWSFCFEGSPIFVNVNSGFHTQRKSRNLGPDLVLVLQLRDAFDHIPGNAAKVREIIRTRKDGYDGIPRSPFLGTYGAPDSLESEQYEISETNDKRAIRCPFLS